MIKQVTHFALGALALVWVGLGHAQVVTYHPLSEDWNTAVEGRYFMETFDDAILHPELLSIEGPTVEIAVAPTHVFAGTPPVLRAVVDGSTTVTFNFARPMIAFGANWDLFNPGGPGSQVTLTLLGGATYTITDWLLNTQDGDFSGIVSETPFTQIVLSEGTGTGQETFEMDNLKFTAAVPEPQSYAMLLAGLGLMGFVARRRRQNLAVA